MGEIAFRACMFIVESYRLAKAPQATFSTCRRFGALVTQDGFRTEHDSLGELKVPATALWGAQTQRAVENFPISGLRMPREFIAALGLIKQAAARANQALGLLAADVAKAVDAAAA